MLRRNALSVIACFVIATFFAISSAHAATPKAACYNAWISTKGLIYQVNLEYDVESEEWESAYYANESTYYAFLEAFDVEKGVRGASLYEARDLLDEAVVDLYYLCEMGLPDDLQQSAELALWYTSYARNVVNKNINSSSNAGNLTR
jgi:hypothetical protein